MTARPPPTPTTRKPPSPMNLCPMGRLTTPGEPRRRLSWGVRLLWAASIVASAGIATAITYGLLAMSPVSASSGAPQVATLHPAPLVEVPSGWFGAGPSSRAWEFHGLTLFETSNGMFGQAPAPATALLLSRARRSPRNWRPTRTPPGRSRVSRTAHAAWEPFRPPSRWSSTASAIAPGSHRVSGVKRGSVLHAAYEVCIYFVPTYA